MIMKKLILLLIILTSFSTFSCKKKKHETDFSTCSPVSYTTDVRALIDLHCNNIECHGAAQAPILTYYSAVKNVVDNGKFAEVVITNRTMPKETSLNEEDFDTFNCWLNDGAPE